jgi:hypothetical protein
MNCHRPEKDIVTLGIVAVGLAAYAYQNADDPNVRAILLMGGFFGGLWALRFPVRWLFGKPRKC